MQPPGAGALRVTLRAARALAARRPSPQRPVNTTEIYLIAMAIIFSVPYLVWRLGRTDPWAPLVVVQILTGIALGPGVLGAAFPGYYQFVFNPAVTAGLKTNW